MATGGATCDHRAEECGDYQSKKEKEKAEINREGTRSIKEGEETKCGHKCCRRRANVVLPLK
ncbi:unnamed protein product [Sphenostylis stenocarpa]|uniref:Uncharacterized protein n=1 Tax=Sphenostylis stenocarpa TaxID=92480 RepID=A0AA86VKF2_9FABA|nr:unnamed protein product [Sphenostylis stenocarpa]